MIFIDKQTVPKLSEIDLPWDGPEASDTEFVTDAINGMISHGYDTFLRACKKVIFDLFGNDTDDASVRDNRKRDIEKIRYCVRRFQAANLNKSYTINLTQERRAMLKKFAISDMPFLLDYAENLQHSKETGTFTDADSDDSEM
jgi:hypothetical protein